MPDQEQPEPYKLVRLNLLVKVAEGELPQDEGSDDYHFELLRLILSNLIVDRHSGLTPMRSVEELSQSETPDITQAAIPDITPERALGSDELRFLLFPGSVVVGSREWPAHTVQAVLAQMQSELANQQAETHNDTDNVVEFKPKT